MVEAPHKYLHALIAEATEQLEQLASELVRIEQEAPGGPLWDSIFRRVHSVKGSAATIGLATIVDIAHVAETLIGKLKAQRRRPERMQVDLLLQATDALVREVQHASGGDRAPDEDRAASGALILGGITMPLCCWLMANYERVQWLFGIPVTSLIVGAALTIVQLSL